MSTTVKKLFEEVGRDILGQATWGQSINYNGPGVYVLAISPNADKMVCFDNAPISKELVEKWIECVPEITVDRYKPSAEALIQRLNAFWLPDETVLYIGKAGTSLKRRIIQYYDTELGESKPHRGGHWIKTLYNLNELSIYWTTSEGESAHKVENDFIKVFVSNVSQERRKSLFDPEHPFPFANLEFPKGYRKKHCLRHQVN